MRINEPLECLDAPGTANSPCLGPVELHTTPGATRAFPRCSSHWWDRMTRRENSMERYADSDAAPDWFDPSYAGERWDDEY